MPNISKQQGNELPAHSSVQIKVPSRRKRSQGELSARIGSKVFKTNKAPRRITDSLLGESPIVSVEAEAEVEASNNILERGSEEFHREQDNSLSLDDVDADSVTEDEEGSVYSPCLSHQYYQQYQD